MALIFTKKENEIIFSVIHAGPDAELGLHYRHPTSEECAAYANGHVKRLASGEIEQKTGENRLEFGLKILTGVRDGDIVVEKDGALVPLSSKEGTPGYDPDWKNLVKDHAASYVMELGRAIFEPQTNVKSQSVAGIGSTVGLEKNE